MDAAKGFRGDTGLRVEPENADAVAAPQRRMAEQQPGIDGVVDSWNTVQRRAHQMSGIEGQDDLVVPFGPEFLADQLAVARRVFPVDRPVVQPRHVVAQGVKLRPLAGLALYLDPESGIPHGKRQGGAADRADIRNDRNGGAGFANVAPLDQPQGAVPAQPETMNDCLTAAVWNEWNPNVGPFAGDYSAKLMRWRFERLAGIARQGHHRRVPQRHAG